MKALKVTDNGSTRWSKEKIISALMVVGGALYGLLTAFGVDLPIGEEEFLGALAGLIFYFMRSRAGGRDLIEDLSKELEVPRSQRPLVTR